MLRLFDGWLPILCLASAAGIYAIPTHYTWEQELNIEGPLTEAKHLETSLATFSKQHADDGSVQETLSKVRCVILSPSRAQCQGTAKSKHEVSRISDFLKAPLSQRLGYLSREGVEARLLALNERLNALADDIDLVNGSIQSVKQRLKPDDLKTLDRVSKNQSTLIKELADKRQQRTVIDEAIPTESNPEVREQFIQKRQALDQAISQLENALGQATSQIEGSLSSDPEGRSLLLSKAKLLEETQDIQRLSQDLRYALETGANRAYFPDPEAFRVFPLNFTPTPQRDWGQIPWSLTLGVILFGLIRKLRRSPAPRDPQGPLKPESFEATSGLRHLGTLR